MPDDSTTATPPGAISRFRDASGNVTGYRLKDGSVKLIGAPSGEPGAAAGRRLLAPSAEFETHRALLLAIG